METDKNVGRVFLVGAGPGDVGLITVRGLEVLRAADVVVYDALANPLLLAQAPAGAELIDVGKRARDHKLTQDETNALLVEKATTPITVDGQTRPGNVVRLKGGDPYLFGRGAEEAAYLARHGVRCEVIPGVTSGIAAPAAAGVPVTHRKIASTVTFVTGHEDPTKPQTSVDYESLAGLIKTGGTVCFYMGVGRLQPISDALQSFGVDAAMPVLVVQWGTLPRQRHVVTTLANAVEDVQAAKLGAPAIIVVGEVAAIDEPGLDFFTSRPLFGQRIVVTRTRHQSSDLSTRLNTLGAEVFEAPTIELQAPDDWSAVDEACRNAGEYDWIVLTSANGVEALASRMQTLGLDARHLAGVRFAAIGDATAAALESQIGIRADLVPTRFVAESLAGELIAGEGVEGKRFLLLRADIARPALPKLLTEAGAEVTELVAYETVPAAALPENLLTALRAGEIDWLTFTSSSTVTNFVKLLGGESDLAKGAKIASIGPITSKTIEDHGLDVSIEAEVSNIDGLVEALIRANAKTELSR